MGMCPQPGVEAVEAFMKRIEEDGPGLYTPYPAPFPGCIDMPTDPTETSPEWKESRRKCALREWFYRKKPQGCTMRDWGKHMGVPYKIFKREMAGCEFSEKNCQTMYDHVKTIEVIWNYDQI